MRVLNLSVLSRSLLIALTGFALNLARAEETPAPTVTITPAAATVAAATNFTFTANVTGGTATSYRWQKASANIVGETNSTLVFTNVLTSDYGSYTVVVGSSAGSVTSPAATLDVVGLPQIVTIPPNVSQFLGEATIFSATIYSTTPVTNGWYFNSVPLTNSGFTNVIFADTVTNGYFTTYAIKLTNLISTNAGVYSLFATNASGATVISAGLTVLDLPDPVLRFGAERITPGGQIQFPVFYTAHGGDTNLSFSVAYDGNVFTNAAFSPNTTESMGVVVTINYMPPWVSMPVLNLTNAPAPAPAPTRNRPKPSALPESANVVVQTTNAPGVLGVSVTLQNGFTIPPGEDPDTLGTLTFDLVPGAANPYAGLVTFTNAPVPLAFLPVALSTNATNSVITTNGVITFTQTPPTFTLFSTGPTLNPQSGVFEHVAEVANPGAVMLDDVFLVVGLLGNDSNGRPISHQNAQGYLTNGATYVTIGGLAPGEFRRVTLEYNVPNYSLSGTTLPPTLTAYGSTLTVFNPPAGSFLDVTTSRFINDGYLIDFPTQVGFRYYVQYVGNVSDFTGTNAIPTALPALLGTGSRVQWLDNGPPKTSSLPTNGGRFYRVLETR